MGCSWGGGGGSSEMRVRHCAVVSERERVVYKLPAGGAASSTHCFRLRSSPPFTLLQRPALLPSPPHPAPPRPPLQQWRCWPFGSARAESSFLFFRLLALFLPSLLSSLLCLALPLSAPLTPSAWIFFPFFHPALSLSSVYLVSKKISVYYSILLLLVSFFPASIINTHKRTHMHAPPTPTIRRSRGSGPSSLVF